MGLTRDSFLVAIFIQLVNSSAALGCKQECAQPQCYNAMELIEKCSCVAEKHNVTTDDGYILQLYRIRHCGSSSLPAAVPRSTVLLVHGLFSSSDDFVLDCNNSLGFILAKQGYDVWLGNVRGNTYSRNHVALDPNKPEFWDFSWHEMGTHDIPAMMDYISCITGQNKMAYIGHSQGTTAFFVMCSLLENYCSRICAGITLAPAAYMGHIKNEKLSKAASLFTDALGKIRTVEVLRHSDAQSKLGLAVCSKSETKCRKHFTSTLFVETKNMDVNILPQIMCHNPAGASLGSLAHYGQSINTGYFRFYDWGEKKNKEVYNCGVPPDYSLSSIKIPVYMLLAQDDDMATYTDAKRACQEIGDNCEMYVSPDTTLSHSDVIWSRQAPYEFYNKVVEYLERKCPIPFRYHPISSSYKQYVRPWHYGSR